MDPNIEHAIGGFTASLDGLKALNAKKFAELDGKLEAASELKERLDKMETRMARPGAGPIQHPGSGPDQRKAAAEFFSVVAERLVAPDEADLDAFVAFEKAFPAYLRRGAAMTPEHLKTLSVGVSADGGYWVTPARSARITQRLFETSPIRSVASVITIGTDALEIPEDPNTGVSGGWVGETGTRSTTATPQIGMKRIPVHEQYALPVITQKLLDDAAFNVEQWLENKTLDIFTRDENTAFVTGNGVDRPEGFLNDVITAAATTQADSARAWGVMQYIATGSSGAFDTSTVDATASPADELIDTVAALKPAYRAGAVWMMGRATEAECQKIRDTQGNYVWRMGNIQQGSPNSLLGFPIVLAEDLPAIAANSNSIVFGNFKAGYTVVDRQGIRILRDPYSDKGRVQVYSTKRTGGGLVNADALKILRFSTS